MNIGKHHLAFLILCLTASTGAFAPASAQAESSEKVGPTLPVSLAAQADKTLDLLFTTGGGTKVEIACEKASAEKSFLEAEGKVAGTLHIRRLYHQAQRGYLQQLQTLCRS